MNAERGIFEEEDEAAEEASIKRAREDVAAGRVVPHRLVREWLQRVGTPEETSMPAEWLR
jgi:predicted transcriptional regulator